MTQQCLHWLQPRHPLTHSKKPLTRVSKRVPGVYGKRGLERGWQKRLAKGWRKVGEGLAQGWRRVSGFPCTLQFRNSRGARLETRVCDSMVSWLQEQRDPYPESPIDMTFAVRLPSVESKKPPGHSNAPPKMGAATRTLCEGNRFDSSEPLSITMECQLHSHRALWTKHQP